MDELGRDDPTGGGAPHDAWSPRPPDAEPPGALATGDAAGVRGERARRCPACGSEALREHLVVEAAEAAQHFVRDYLDPGRHAALLAHIRSLWPEGRARIVACTGCELHFADPLVGGDAAFYNLAYPGDPRYPRDKWEFRRTLEALADVPREARPTLSVLEIGAGAGAFLDRLVAFGADPARVRAHEFNEHSLGVLRAKGFEAGATSFTDDESDARFDLVFLFQVLEHLDRPDRVFARLAASLAPGGRAFVAVPNPARIGFNESHGSLLDMPPNHVTRWSPAAFAHLAARHGLELAAAEVEPGGVRAFLAHDIGYRYLRRTMDGGSFAARTYRRRGTGAERLARLVAAGALGAARVPTWLAAAPRMRDFGSALWVELRAPARD